MVFVGRQYWLRRCAAARRRNCWPARAQCHPATPDAGTNWCHSRGIRQSSPYPYTNYFSRQYKVADRDDWRGFARMSVAIICRSIVFVGIGSFIVLFMHQYRGVNEDLASASLFVFYIGGAFGTAIGGYLARRWPRTTILRWAYVLAVPVLAGLLLTPGPLAWT